MAVAQQLFAFTRQDQAAADPIEKLQAKLLLQGTDLARQSRLGNAQSDRRFGDGAEFGHSHKGACVFQVHTFSYAELA